MLNWIRIALVASIGFGVVAGRAWADDAPGEKPAAVLPQDGKAAESMGCMANGGCCGAPSCAKAAEAQAPADDDPGGCPCKRRKQAQEKGAS